MRSALSFDAPRSDARGDGAAEPLDGAAALAPARSTFVPEA
jgi:hypothetical protein